MVFAHTTSVTGTGLSEVSVQFAFSATMNCTNHVAKVAHAHVEAGGVAEHAIVELGLIRLSISWRISDRVSILALSVATPHSVDGLLAGQEVVRSLLKHFRMTHVHTDLKVLAVTVSVSKISDLVCSGGDSLYFHAKFMLTSLLFLPVDRILKHLVIEAGGEGCATSCRVITHYFLN